MNKSMQFFCCTILMQCIEIESLLGVKLNLTFLSVSKPHTHKLYILRLFANILYTDISC